jgi:tetratricopeptide (TPR) repeat protein
MGSSSAHPHITTHATNTTRRIVNRRLAQVRTNSHPLVYGLAVPMATLSLCMIVRDEEAMLPACLESVRDVVDEIIVVDTGSVDATVQLACAAGARTLSSPWCDDFAAPRNVGLAAARSDWILVLDADERLTKPGAIALRRALERDDFDCGMLPLHNASRVDAPFDEVVAGRARVGDVAYLPRLFRRTPDLRYGGIVHENVGDWLFGGGRRAKMLPGVDLVHLGAVPDVRQKREKSRRNVGLLERACALAPEDPSNWGYLAFELLESGDPQKARAAADAGFRAFTAGNVTSDLSALRLTVVRAWLQVQSGETDGARETLATASHATGEHPDLHFIHGCIAELEALRADSLPVRRERLGAALAHHDAALALADGMYLQKFIDGSAGWAAQVRCGTLLLLLGRSDEARRAFEAALAANPAAREAAWGRAEAILVGGDPRGALREVQPHLDERPDGWTIAALAGGVAGSVDAMATWLGRAQSLLPAGFLSPPRRERYADALATLALLLGRDVDVPGPLGTLAALVAGSGDPRLGSPARGLEDPLVRTLVDRLVRRWLESGRTELVERLLAPETERTLPGLGASIERVLRELERSGAPR